MRILGIDPGTKCGWALREPSGSMISGVWNLAVARHESGGMRFIRLRGHLNEIYNATPFDLLAYEEVARHRGTSAAHIYGGIVAVIQAWVIDCNCSTTKACDCAAGENLTPPINHTAIPVGTIKKFATGKGNANKDMMKSAAADRWLDWGGSQLPQGIDDNEADARFIAECAASQLGADT